MKHEAGAAAYEAVLQLIWYRKKLFTMKQVYSLFVSALISVSAFAQNAKDTADGRFQDDLLDHLVGKWNVKSIAHGFSSTATVAAEWILNHQHMHLHFKGDEVIPWIGIPMEFHYFIGYNQNSRHYVVHGVSVFGNDDDEGFWYAYRNGNELKIIGKPIITSDSDTLNIQRLIWHPETNAWSIQTRPGVNGKEGELFLDMKLTIAKPSSK